MPFTRRAFYRRKLPHLQCDAKPHFITFCTDKRRTLPETARSLVLESCRHDHAKKYNLRIAVVMPEHVHLILTPLVHPLKREICSLAEIMNAIKGASAHQINRLLGRTGRVWQPESFDRVLRCSENLDAKVAYILDNPVRKGLVGRWTDYPWILVNQPPNPHSPVTAELRSAGQPGAAVPT